MTHEIACDQGWTLFALDAVFVLAMFVSRNVQRCRRGMATAFGIALAPIVAVFAGVLYLSQSKGSVAGMIVGVVLVAMPALIVARFWLNNFAGNLRADRERALKGKFADAHLTKIARAIDRNDGAAIRELARARTDFNAGDKFDRTFLDHAVDCVLDSYEATGGDAPVDALHTLLELGAPPNEAAHGTDEPLMAYVVSDSNQRSVAVVRLLLDAGGDPNARDRAGLPLIHLLHCDLPKLKLLTEHGADLNLLNTRPDRKGCTAIMNDAYMRQWPEALYLLERGAPVAYRPPDGQTLASILEEKSAEYKLYQREVEQGTRPTRSAVVRIPSH